MLLDHNGSLVSAFSLCLSLDDLRALGYPTKSTVIFEAELLALLVGFILWKKLLLGRPCVAYVDNNSTRDVSISGCARSQPGSALVSQLLAAEDAAGVAAWYARVPSDSNIADGPSRGSCAGLGVKMLPQEFVRLTVSKCLSRL